MIAYIRLQRFKCFLDQTVQLGPLSILSGTNSTGKSTVLQSLLFLRQSILSDSFSKNEVPLNGSIVHLGTARDVFCQWGDEESIIISLALTGRPDDVYRWELVYDRAKPEAFYLELKNGHPTLSPESLFAKRFTCIEAGRIGPQLTYPVSEDSIETMHVGFKGEYTAHCLQQFGDHKLKLSELKHSEDDKSSELLFQVGLWLNDMIPGIMLKSDRITQADILHMGFRNYEKDTNYMRPTSVGFGISYCLPIIVAGLMADKDSLIIIENPEAHLHPRAQSRMGFLLSRLAAAGVQVIVETHSDHLLNGIRVAVKKGFIKGNEISINFFDRDYRLICPSIDSDGRIDLWPDEFFDQAEKDLGELI